MVAGAGSKGFGLNLILAPQDCRNTFLFLSFSSYFKMINPVKVGNSQHTQADAKNNRMS